MSLLLVTGAMELLVAALDLSWIALGWVLWWMSAFFVDADRTRGHSWRGTGALVFGVVPFLIATGLCAIGGLALGLPKAFDLPSLTARGLPPSIEPWVFAGFAVAIGTRMGVFPLQSWIPALLEGRGDTLAAPAFVGVKAGFVVLARVVLPLLPGAAARHSGALIALGLITSGYAAVSALAQRDLRRAVGFVAVSQAGPMLVGVACLERAGLAGALLYALGTSLSLTGLLCVIGSIAARTGTTDIESLGGLVSRAPRAASAFLLFGLGAVGFPGSIVFVAEDLLLHGVLERHPIVAGVLLLTTVLNAITIVRAYVRAFLGRPLRRGRLEGPHPIEDLLRRERVAVLLLLAVLLGGGVVPQPLLAMHERAVEALVPTRAEAPQEPSNFLHEG
jgi:NADH-quinone oxidoreductase subunit M